MGVTVGFLVVTGVGSFIGVALGPMLVDRCGGYADDQGKYKSLVILVRITAVCSLGAIVAIAAVIVHFFDHSANTSSLKDVWLWVSWIAVSFIYSGDSATIATHTAINVEVVPEA